MELSLKVSEPFATCGFVPLESALTQALRQGIVISGLHPSSCRHGMLWLSLADQHSRQEHGEAFDAAKLYAATTSDSPS